MPNLINVFVPVKMLLSDIRTLLQDSGMRVYMETIKGEDSTIIEIVNLENEDYHSLYFSSEAFLHESFYDDDFCVHAIEVRGGRSEADAVENLSLRVISKTPDKVVKSFMDKLSKYLKNSGEYGMGVQPDTSAYHRRVFYHKEAVEGKRLWVDFGRRVSETRI